MATTFTSTVPGALEALFGHFQTIATSTPGPNTTGAYLGIPAAEIANNYLMVGDYRTGNFLTGYRQTIPVFPGSAARQETYGIPCTIRVWTGSSTPTGTVTAIARLTDAFALFDAVLSTLRVDPTGGGALTTAGIWHVSTLSIPETGPFSSGGWGAILTFTVTVNLGYLTS